MKGRIVLLFFIGTTFFTILFSSETFAQSDYVLPYPSFMPGNKLYKPAVFLENLQKYWYFGNLSQIEYNLKLSDKYLVEAKILFEYKQYALAVKALNKSDRYFLNLPSFLQNAIQEGKNISKKEKLIKNAALKHTEVLKSITQSTPIRFLWHEEKSSPVMLYIRSEIEESIKIRE